MGGQLGSCTNCDRNPRRSIHSTWCQKCSNEYERARWAKMSVEQKRAKWLKTKFNMTWEDYEELYIDQGGRCALCDIEISITTTENGHQTACVDHDHKSGRIRGLLCNHCNRALGLIKDDVAWTSKARKYLGDDI